MNRQKIEELLLEQAREEAVSIRKSLFVDGASELSEDRLVAVLAATNARLSFLERFLDSRLSMMGAGSGKFLRDELSWDADELFPMGGFYEPDLLSTGGFFVWSQDRMVSLQLPVERGRPKLLTLDVIGVIDDTPQNALTVTVDGESLPLGFRSTDGAVLVQGKIPASNEVGITELRISVPKAIAPSDVSDSRDHRQLGVALRGLSISNIKPSLLRRLLPAA